MNPKIGGKVIDVIENTIVYDSGKYFYEIDGCVFGAVKFMATRQDIEARSVPLLILPDRSMIYFGDNVRTSISKIHHAGGSVYGKLRLRAS